MQLVCNVAPPFAQVAASTEEREGAPRVVAHNRPLEAVFDNVRLACSDDVIAAWCSMVQHGAACSRASRLSTIKHALSIRLYTDYNSNSQNTYSATALATAYQNSVHITLPVAFSNRSHVSWSLNSEHESILTLSKPYSKIAPASPAQCASSISSDQ